MTDQGNEKKGLFYKVECREDALKLTKDTANVWYIISVINVVFYSMSKVPAEFYVFPALWVLMATGVRLLHSRVAAVLLLVAALWSCYGTFTMATSGGGASYIEGFIWSIAMLWASVRAIEATFLLTGQFAQPDQHG